MKSHCGTLCIRADADSTMGTGHVMRCIALAQAWQDRGGGAVLATQHLPTALQQRCEAEKITVQSEIPPETAFVVLDGYHFIPEYHRSIKQNGHKLLLVDDLAETDLSAADIVLNHNPYATAAMYPGLRSLCGSRYTLLRREFAAKQPRNSPACAARRLLITLGGADTGNATLVVLEQLAMLVESRLKIQIIVGAANPHLSTLHAVLQRLPDAEIFVNPPNLPELMSASDAAITAAGSTCWELAAMGVPMMCLMTADNQRGVATYLESHRLAESLGNQAQFPAAHSLEQIRAFLRDDSRRARMSEAARKVVDGQGAKRVIDALINYPLTLRRATPSDARLLWEWVNDPVVRLSAFDTASIQWEQHQEWLARRLQDSNTSIWIGLDEKGVPIGQVRFELNNETATVDTSIAASQRGKGHAPKLLRLAVSALFDEPGRLCAKAWIKPGNLASQHAFTRAGFRRTGEETMHGGTAIGYCLKKS